MTDADDTATAAGGFALGRLAAPIIVGLVTGLGGVTAGSLGTLSMVPAPPVQSAQVSVTDFARHVAAEGHPSMLRRADVHDRTLSQHEARLRALERTVATLCARDPTGCP